MDIKRGYVLVTITFALIILSGNFAVAAWTEELNDNLVAYWKLDNSSIDSTGNGHDGTTENIFYSSGLLEQSITQEGCNNKFSINQTDFQFMFNEFSINLWVNNPNSSWDQFIGSYNNTGGVEYGWSLYRVDNVVYWWNNGTQIFGSLNAPLNNFVMVTLVANSTDFILYINGTFDKFSSRAGKPTWSKDKIFFGDKGGVNCNVGKLDEIGIWNRSLTQSEVSQLYNSGNGITYVPTTPPAPTEWTEELNDNLIAYWKLNKPNQGNSLGANYNQTDIGISYSSGLIENASKFSGSSSRINISNSSLLPFGTNDIAINFWVNYTNTQSEVGFLGTYDPIDTGWLIYALGGEDSSWTLSFRNGGDLSLMGNSPLQNNHNNMITLVGNATHWTFFLNGNFDSAISRANPMSTNNQALTFGFVHTGSVAYLEGLLDEIGIWNRSLTQSEVSQLYNNGNGITYTDDFNPPTIPANQSGFWTLNGTNLYTSNSSYKVGIGTSIPSTALEVIGEILASDDVCISGGICLSDISGINFANFALINSVNTFLENQIFDGGIVVNGDTNISGNLYLNGKDVYASLPQIIKVVENISTSSTALTDITGLNFNVTAGKYYHFRFLVPFRSSVTGTGLKLSLSVPSYAMFSATAHIPRAGDGPGAEAQGWITYSDDAVIGSGVQAANTDYLAVIEGVIKPSADGVVQARFASETTNTITIREGSIEYLYQI